MVAACDVTAGAAMTAPTARAATRAALGGRPRLGRVRKGEIMVRSLSAWGDGRFARPGRAHYRPGLLSLGDELSYPCHPFGERCISLFLGLVAHRSSRNGCVPSDGASLREETDARAFGAQEAGRKTWSSERRNETDTFRRRSSRGLSHGAFALSAGRHRFVSTGHRLVQFNDTSVGVPVPRNPNVVDADGCSEPL